MFLSTFLSHSSKDKPLVEQVATHLSQRGILVWLDKYELTLGPLEAALEKAVQDQATITIFLSDASLQSDWCKDELRWAMKNLHGYEDIFPVYLGDSMSLVQRHDWLRTRFLHKDGDRVNQYGFHDSKNPTNPDPEAIAEKIATAIYQRLIPTDWDDIAIILDQRGNGPRRGKPVLQDNCKNLNIPTLVFRPSLNERSPRDVLSEEDWEIVSNRMIMSLQNALGTVLSTSPRTIRVFGFAQTGLMWLIGQYFERSSRANLYVYGQNGIPVTNEDQIRHKPLTGGNPQAAITLSSEPLSGELDAIALGIGNHDSYASLIQKAFPDLPLLWLEVDLISSSDEAMTLVADIVATLQSLRQTHQLKKVLIFWTTVNTVAVLASANLTPHVISEVQFMEWDHVENQYRPLPMP